MNRRRVLLSCTLVIGAIAAVLLWPTGPRPCREKFELVQRGMTLEEITAVVGAPPGVYSNRLDYPILRSGVWLTYSKTWVAHDSTLDVTFNLDGEAIGVAVYDPPPDNRSLIRKTRDRIRF